MWDTKRQIIWIAAGLIFGTLVLYQEAHDETGRFDARYFAILEMLLIIIMGVMLTIYHKNSDR